MSSGRAIWWTLSADVISTVVLGYALGPIIFAPMSELYGRRLPIIIAAFGFGVFNIGVVSGRAKAVGEDVGTDQTFQLPGRGEGLPNPHNMPIFRR